MQFILRFHQSYSSIIKINPQSELLINNRFIKKQYLKYPKPIDHINGTLEDLYFHFHCKQNALSFDQKMVIMQSMIHIANKEKDLHLFGIRNLINSLQTDLQSLCYTDSDEYNISQFINMMHEIQFYETQSWVVAMDNYHKQGILNWIQYREFTHAVYDFSFKLSEVWHLNIVSDISQEAFNDFIGFVENQEQLEIEKHELQETYDHLRKFNVKATKTNVLSIIQFFMRLISSKSQTQISSETYKFLLSFTLDHTQYPELNQGILSLFVHLMDHLYQDTKEFTELDTILSSFDQYLLLIGVLVNQNYSQNLEQSVSIALGNQLIDMFLKGKLKSESYNSMKNLIKLKQLIKQDKQFFIETKTILEQIDEINLNNLKQIKQQKQDLLSIIETHQALDVKDHFLSVIAKADINLEDVEFTDQELIESFKRLDENELVYYLQDFLEAALIYITNSINNFSGEDWCFTFYLLYKYIVKDHEDPTKFDGQLSILKQYIKLHYMTNYRRAIPQNSSFYKILSVVEMETFYADDLINYY